MATELKREAFTTSLNLDAFTERGLATETGHSRSWWPEMTLKELTDNSIDACEVGEAAPEVRITIDSESIAVRDNGVGLPVETIRSIAKFDSRISTNSKYISPTRGSQGNALLTLFALTQVVDGTEGHVAIETGGKLHEIRVRVDPIKQEPVATLSSTNGQIVKTGTSVRLGLTMLNLESKHYEFLQMATGYGFFNPHLSITLDAPQGTVYFEPTNPEWKKWLPTLPTSILWYNLNDAISLIVACIGHDVQLGRERTIRELVGTFDGFSSSKKQKAVLDAAGLSGEKLSVLVPEDVDREAVSRLLDAMKKVARDVNSSKLGIIGAAHLKQRCCEMGGEPDSFHYKRVAGVVDGMPYAVEAAFIYLGDDCGRERIIVAGVNFSPAVQNFPFDDLEDYSLEGTLSKWHCDQAEPILVVLHLVTPKPVWTDKGKSQLSMTDEVAASIITVISSVTRKWAKLRLAEERDANRRANRHDEMARQKRKENHVSLKDAILLVIDEAIEITSGGGQYEFDGRTFYYGIRKRIQEYTEATLSQGYLDAVLKDYQEEHGVIDLMMRDPRGYLIEPHTGNVIPLGTRSVEAYAIPAWLFHTVLYVEKKGMADLLMKSGIAERYDIAIIAAEGYATDAAKLLMSKATEQHITLLCLHDADPVGKNIHRNLERAGLRSDNITVIDIGLSLDEAIELNLELEVFHRVKALPNDLDMTEIERLRWEGEYVGQKGRKGQYRGHRIELNALATIPQNFIDFVNSKLDLHGLARNLVPPEHVVLSASEDAARSAVRETALEIVSDIIGLDSLLSHTENDIESRVNHPAIQSKLSAWGNSKAKAEAWRAVVDRLAKKDVGEQRKRIAKMVRESLASL